MDPRYTDFGELEFVSIASYNIIEKNKKSVTSPISFVQQLKAMLMLGWGGGETILHFIDSIWIPKETLDLGGNPSWKSWNWT